MDFPYPGIPLSLGGSVLLKGLQSESGGGNRCVKIKVIKHRRRLSDGDSLKKIIIIKRSRAVIVIFESDPSVVSAGPVDGKGFYRPVPSTLEKRIKLGKKNRNIPTISDDPYSPTTQTHHRKRRTRVPGTLWRVQSSKPRATLERSNAFFNFDFPGKQNENSMVHNLQGLSGRSFVQDTSLRRYTGAVYLV